MQIISLRPSAISIPPERQRAEFKPEELMRLAESISSVGLIHPIVVRKEPTSNHYWLVAGERRLRAIETLWMQGQAIKCAGEFYSGLYPCVDQGALTELEAYEMELAENVDRADLTWQEKAKASAQLIELKRLVASKRGEAEPSIAKISQEIRPEHTPLAAINTARKELILSKMLDNPDIAKAPSLDAAYKIHKRNEELRESAALGERIGKTFSKADHVLLNTHCIQWMHTQPPEQFDVILTDPPYGMDAQEFADSGGKAGAGSGNTGRHFYDDSFETWDGLMDLFSTLSFRIAKPQAHLYCFCDIDNFSRLKFHVETAGWQVFRTPIIWHNPTSNRAPWPEHGPMRKWQAILYAIKGKKLCNRLAPDLITCPSDLNLNHQAQKPVALFKELLGRSSQPGNAVLDPFAGTGPILSAAHELKVKATAVELDPAAYGIMVKRLEGLK